FIKMTHGLSRDFPKRQMRPSRAGAVCWGLLCVLLLAGIISLGFYQKNQLETSNNNLTTERDNNNLNKERDQLQTSYNIMTKKRDQLQTSYNNLAKKCGQLKTERDSLKRAGPKGWREFQSTWYYISSEVKSWDESKQDCRERGADLVIINSKEEQTFLTNLNKRVWIGLTDKDREGTWKWVDGTPLTTTYWIGKNPDNKMEEDCAEIFIGPVEGNWNDLSCATHLNWICERTH
uniref:C-type lectin domain-containing protein n=1 Tax=Hucho hucho TaxID=62062 RepID=A0A4W5Q9I7_9TELE